MKVLTVCTGNVCRSPVAQLLLTRSQAFGTEAEVTSAGLAAMVGHPLDSEMHQAIGPLGCPGAAEFHARQLTIEAIKDADLILTATAEQRSQVVSMHSPAIEHTFTLLEYAALVRQFGRDATLSTLREHRGSVASRHDIDIADPHQCGVDANRLAAVVIAAAVADISGRPDPDAVAAIAGRNTIRVLESFPEPRETTNPYVVQLLDALRSRTRLEVQTFSWRRLLRGRYDVVHVHWAEAALNSPSRVKQIARRVLFWGAMVRLGRRRTAIVRTMHNLEPHEAPGWLARKALAAMDKRVTLRIVINPVSEGQVPDPVRLILHGHYRDWFDRFQRERPQEGSLAFFGLVRQYKGVDLLLEAVKKVPGDISLMVAGRASPESLATQLEISAAEDPRITLDLRFIPDEELVTIVTHSRLVALPYRELHNSGGALAALSLDRPVLVPRNESTELLAAEVGQDWVIRFDGELSPSTITAALEQAADVSGQPDLSARTWSLTGALHEAAFAEAALRASDKGRARRG